MSFTEASGAGITRTFNGVSVTFVLPIRNEVGQQIASWAATDKAKILGLLKEAGADASLKFAILNRHDQDSRLLTYGMRCAMEFDRSGEIVKKACGRESIDDFGMSPEDVVELALELWGFPPVKTAGGSGGSDDASKEAGARPLD